MSSRNANSFVEKPGNITDYIFCQRVRFNENVMAAVHIGEIRVDPDRHSIAEPFHGQRQDRQ
jgi:hypothetical protein